MAGSPLRLTGPPLLVAPLRPRESASLRSGREANPDLKVGETAGSAERGGDPFRAVGAHDEGALLKPGVVVSAKHTRDGTGGWLVAQAAVHE